VGGSVSLFGVGNYSKYIEFACSNVEHVNLSKVAAGAPELVGRFRQYVLGDKAFLRSFANRERWLLFQGGLNSVGTPARNVEVISAALVAAKKAGFSTMGITLNPWGSERDSRFAGFSGVRRIRSTLHHNRWILGQLDPVAALGSAAMRRPPELRSAWRKDELPDIAVDVFDTELLDREAALRPSKPIERAFARSEFRADLGQKDALIAEARAVPRSFMKRAFHSFDHTHPNTLGHRVMARQICHKAPPSWGCACGKLDGAIYRKGRIAAE